MKDLTHYFVSPEKSRENIEPDTTINNLENGGSSLSKKCEPDDKSDDVIVKAKRSRVKIRISLKGSSKNQNNNNNNRCDIIDSTNDVVDKTPSPFKKLNEENGALGVREETPDAFKLLMTRKKSITFTPSDTASTPVSKEYKAKLKQSKERLVVLAERKGYSKRKHAEIEEAEFIEKRLEKRAKIFRLKDDGDIKKNKNKNRNKKKRGNKSEGDAVSNGHKNSDNDDNKSKSKYKKIGKGPRDDKETERVQKTDQESLYSPFGKTDTPKNKIKWSLRVKLQTHSDGDDERDDYRGEDNNGNGNLSHNTGDDDDDDYIFTPKSKVKFVKRKTRKISSDVEVKEEKKPGDEIETSNKRGEVAIADSCDSPKPGKHHIEQNRKKEDNSPTIVIADEEEEENVQILDSNITDINDCPKILQEKKLAPLFMKRSKPNPAAIEAKKSFLQSGIPEAVKKKISDQKSSALDLGTSSMPFPTISHVYQSETEPDNQPESEPFYKLKPEDNQRGASVSFDLSRLKSLYNFGVEIAKESIKPQFKSSEKEDFETVLKDIESRCSDAQKLWERVSSTVSSNPAEKKSPKRRTKKFKLQRKSDPKNLLPEENPDNPNPTWTCKYKPMSSDDVVGNELAISKLRNWLSGWRQPSPKEDRSSGEEFYSSDCSSSSYYENNQVAVLLGPYGSGKTASVYAIAEELGYRVLEVNASSKRTGKKILADFQEATKSHRVKRDQNPLLYSKKKILQRKVPQNSLILIEDVDLIFEEDEGFVSATFQLAANTRRPIVMTCQEACPHINRMAPQQQFIKFQTASGNRVAALLELIAFAESGYRLPRSCLNIILRNGDLRQSLLQLQYILLSGPPAVSQLGISSVLAWADLQTLVYKPAIKSAKKNRKEQSAKRDIELVESLADKLDSVSLISSLTELENPASPPWKKKLNPSLSLLEDFGMYSNTDIMGTEIADWLRIASIGSEPPITSRDIIHDPKAQMAIKRKVKIGIDLALSQAIPSTLEHRSKSTDYLPLIRTMCRSEENRASINTKRGKRFHNYLHGLNLASASSNILAAASSVFRDKT